MYAPLDIVLTDYDVVQPDLVLFTRERQHLIDPKKVDADEVQSLLLPQLKRRPHDLLPALER